MYLRGHWELLRRLRSALRTEPNVRLAVLFGSTATGADRENSDLDMVVVLGDDTVQSLVDLAGRLTRRLERDVQLVRLHDAERSPVLMSAVLQEGRVLVDREGRWQKLSATASVWKRRARRAEQPLTEAIEDLDVDQRPRA
jgi:predicted nucleotidyltransferase